MFITMSVMPPFTYPSQWSYGHDVIIVLWVLQIFLCHINQDVTRVHSAMLSVQRASVLAPFAVLRSSVWKGDIRCETSIALSPPQCAPAFAWASRGQLDPASKVKVSDNSYFRAKVCWVHTIEDELWFRISAVFYPQPQHGPYAIQYPLQSPAILHIYITQPRN
jgi:hypothetical protein